MSVDPAQSLQRKSLQFGAAVVALIGACAGTGLLAAYSLGGALQDSSAANDAILNHLTADMMHDALRSDVALALLASSDPALGLKLADIEADAREHARELRDRISRNESKLKGDAGRVVGAVAGPLEDYVRASGDMIALAKRDPVAARSKLPEFQKSFETLETAMSNASEAIRAQSVKQTSQASDESKIFEVLTLLLALTGVGVCVLLVVVARRQLVRPLIELSDCLIKLSAGDTEATVDVGKRGDEIGAMAGALDSFRNNERERRRLASQQVEDAARAERDRITAVEEAERVVVDSIGSSLSRLAGGDLVYRMSGALPPAYARLKTDFNSAMEQLQGVLKSILSNASGIGAGTREISHASDNLSRRTEQQAASLEETAAALDEITATISRTADGARTASGIIVTARSEAEKSGAIVNSAVQAMSAIEKSAAQISQIIGVIDEIAFQTNLLALNAGVEAARAGEAGRGFAVVAQEVRALAQRSAEAAKEIKGLISASSAQVSEGVKLVDETGEALHRIVTRVIEIDSLVTEIAASATEQSTALHQVNSAVNQMDQATQQNAAMVEQTTAATHSLDRETEALVALIRKFEIGAPVAAPVAASPTRKVTPRRAVAVSSATSSGNRAVAYAAAPESDNWEEF